MISLHSIEILEDWQLGWVRRKVLVPMALPGPMKSIYPKIWDKIMFYLLDEKTLCIKGEDFAVEYVREGAKYILEGLDH